MQTFLVAIRIRVTDKKSEAYFEKSVLLEVLPRILYLDLGNNLTATVVLDCCEGRPNLRWIENGNVYLVQGDLSSIKTSKGRYKNVSPALFRQDRSVWTEITRDQFFNF